MMSEMIFTLDIGTRSVIGLLIEDHGDSYKLIDYVMKEHSKRSMIDGQIHDIALVADVIKSQNRTRESTLN